MRIHEFFSNQENRENALLLAIVPLSSIGAWFIPGKYHYHLVYGLLGIGVLFDLYSFFCHLMTILTRKYSSGFPFVGLFFYGWFVLASRFSFMAPQGTGFPQLLMVKLLDLLALIALHALFQSPMLMQGPRERYR